MAKKGHAQGCDQNLNLEPSRPPRSLWSPACYTPHHGKLGKGRGQWGTFSWQGFDPIEERPKQH